MNRRLLPASAGIALLLITTFVVATPVEASSSYWVANCSANIRTAPKVSATIKKTISTGTTITASGSVTGGSYGTWCGSRYVSGYTWLKVTAISGKSVYSLYGVSVLYAARSLFHQKIAYTFDEEFNGTSLAAVWGTSAHWSYLSQAVASRSQSTVANGVLTISAVRTSSGWKSDSIDTWRRWSQRYGYFEARLRFTAGYGAWPAFWVAEDWTSGHTNELDINETLANPVGGTRTDTSKRYYATIHYDSTSTGKWSSGSFAYNSSTDLAGGWHVYAMDWRASYIRFYVDGVLWRTFSDTSHIPSVAMPLIFDLAMGGWAGSTTSTTPSPTILQVDWVRVRP